MKNEQEFYIVIQKGFNDAEIFTTIQGVKDFTGESEYKIRNNKSKKYVYLKKPVNKNMNKSKNAKVENLKYIQQ